MLAKIARSEAMAGLASAVREEAKCEELGRRTHSMAQQYEAHRDHTDGSSLCAHAQFAGSLRQVASQAEAARLDARDQASWQAETLAACETRAKRLSERLNGAERALEQARERRELGNPSTMARKLQSPGRTNS